MPSAKSLQISDKNRLSINIHNDTGNDPLDEPNEMSRVVLTLEAVSQGCCATYLSSSYLSHPRLNTAPRMSRILVVLALPLLSAAWNQTHFELYKNTHFGPCAPANATAGAPIADDGAGASLKTNGSLSAAAFCDRFWNYTVLPSTPEDGAFGLSWVNVLVNIVFWVISAVTLLLWHRKNRGQDLDTYEIAPLLWTAQEERVQKQSKSLLQRIWRRITFNAAKWWTVLLFSLATTVLWWQSFILMLRRPSTSHAMLSPVAVLSMLGYFITFRTDIPKHYYIYLRWTLLLAVVLQLAAGGWALSLFYKSHAHAPQYAISPSFDLAPFPCDGATLLRDPTNTTLLLSLGAAPLILAYALFVLALLVAALTGFSIQFLAAVLGYMYGILTIFSIFSLPIVSQRETDPVAWDPRCGLVHVMMGSGWGYLDVKGPEDLQSVKTILGIKW
ncbi:hypothetical protein B0H10DRAFT_1951327 [Mycena sp. CBHHK59/15]|nr:hypothetical protein B0H10DRAFT_1951327 [Mycena sp. CBHHK59/15]